MNFSGDYTGLSGGQAEENLGLYGYNTETKLEEDGKGYNVAHAFLDFRFILLVIAAVLCVIVNDFLTGGILLLFAVVYSVSRIVAGIRCDDELYRLKNMTRMKFRVVRDGEITLQRREYIVPDDIIILQGGENVPADAHLLEIRDLSVDESFFTGSDEPVGKIVGADVTTDDIKASCIYRGTKIAGGYLVARVTATGVDTKKFKTFGATKFNEQYYTSYERAANKACSILTIVAAVMLVFGTLFHFSSVSYEDENALSSAIYQTFYPAIAFALCFIPCELSLIIRIYYITGAKRLAAKHAVVKDISVLETINSLTCIVIDKDTTVTSNRMEVADEYTANSEMLSNIGVMSCSLNPSDKVEQAIIFNATFKQIDVRELQRNEILREYPYSSGGRVDGRLWSMGDARLLCIKGSPEAVMSLCDIPHEQLYKSQNKCSYYGSEGYQVIAVAYARLDGECEIPENLLGTRFTLAGLLAFTNQTKSTIPNAIRNCYKAGIKVIMTTDDSAETANAIAKKIGIKSGGTIMGEQLAEAQLSGMSPDITDINIFAHVSATRKSEILRLLQERGEIVAITGDTATDSDVLEQANIGVTRQQNVSGAAYEASDLLVNDDDFNNIVDTLKESRQIHSNIKRVIALSIAAQVATSLFGIVTMLRGSSTVFTPIVLALMSVLFIPALSMLYINNSSGIRETLTPSGFIGKGIMNKKFFAAPLIQGALLGVMMIFFNLLAFDGDDAGMIGEASAEAMFMLIFGIMTAAWINMSPKSIFANIKANTQGAASVISGCVLLLTMLLIYVPFVNEALGFASINIGLLALTVVFCLISQLWAELSKHRHSAVNR